MTNDNAKVYKPSSALTLVIDNSVNRGLEREYRKVPQKINWQTTMERARALEEVLSVARAGILSAKTLNGQFAELFNYLHWERGLSTNEINKLLFGREGGTVCKKAKRLKLRVRNLSEASKKRCEKHLDVMERLWKKTTKHQYDPFREGILEKAYMLGLKEDYNVSWWRRKIRVTSSTNVPAMLQLHLETFRDGPTYIYPAYDRDGERYEWHVTTQLDASYSFLSEDPKVFLRKFNKAELFNYLGGLIAAEGSTLILKNGIYFRYAIEITNANKALLKEVQNRLHEVGFCTKLYRSKRAGEDLSANFRRNRDKWVLCINGKQQVLELLKLIPVRHKDKELWTALMVKIGNFKYWRDVENRVLALRKEIKVSKRRCREEAGKEYWRRKQGYTNVIESKNLRMPESLLRLLYALRLSFSEYSYSFYVH